MTRYLYRCPVHGLIELDHPMAEVDRPHVCPCGKTAKRVITAQHHRWPSNHRPGFEDTGNRQFLDPDFQARKRDEFAEAKAAHLKREEAERERLQQHD